MKRNWEMVVEMWVLVWDISSQAGGLIGLKWTCMAVEWWMGNQLALWDWLLKTFWDHVCDILFKVWSLDDWLVLSQLWSSLFLPPNPPFCSILVLFFFFPFLPFLPFTTAKLQKNASLFLHSKLSAKINPKTGSHLPQKAFVNNCGMGCLCAFFYGVHPMAINNEWKCHFGMLCPWQWTTGRSCSGLIGVEALIGLSCHGGVMEKHWYCCIKLHPLSFSANKMHHS